MTLQKTGRVDRRRLVASTTIGAAAVLGAGYLLGAQTPASQSATPAAGQSATPAASPIATPAASPAASPVATPAASPDTLGVPMFRGNAGRTGYIPGPLPSLNEPIVLKWQFFMNEDNVSGQPVLVDGVVYFAGGVFDDPDGGTLYALDAKTGLEQWRFRYGEVTTWVASPTVMDGMVFIGSDTLYALDAKTGLELWRFEGEAGSSFAPPAATRGTVYVQSNGQAVHALDAQTGEEQWRFSAPERLSTLVPSVAHDTVFVGSGNGYVYAIDAASGLERWRFTTGEWIGYPASVFDELVYVTSGDASIGTANLYALDAQDGTEQWRYSTGLNITSMVSVSDGSVYFTSDDLGLHALDPRSGEPRWRFDLSRWSQSSSSLETAGNPEVVAGLVFLLINETVLAIEAESGTLVRELGNVYLERFPSPPIAVDGTIYIGYKDMMFAVGNLPTLTIATDTTLRGAPSNAGVERAQLQAGAEVRSTGERENQSGFSWLEVTTGEVTGWIPLDDIEPSTLPPDNIVTLYEP